MGTETGSESTMGNSASRGGVESRGDLGDLDLGWILEEIHKGIARTVQRFDQLDQDGQAAARVPKLDWTVTELAGHLLSLPTVYRGLHKGDIVLGKSADFDRLINELVEQAGRPSLGEVVQTLPEVFEAWLSELVEAGGPDGLGPYGWWVPNTAMGVAGAALGEFLLHNLDLDPVDGARSGSQIRPRHARAVVSGILPAMTRFYDPAKVQKCHGVYRMTLRGNKRTDQPRMDWTITVDATKDASAGADGTGPSPVTVESGRTARPDLRLSLDPVSALLVTYGRANPFLGTYPGSQFAWGAKPWLALPFSGFASSP